jgi:CO/xanthine dehydrogenase Mo-binding subunit
MLSDNAGRDLDVTCTLGFDADHKLLAYKVDSLSNLGAYNSAVRAEHPVFALLQGTDRHL